MPVGRRERVIAIWLGSTGNGRNPMSNGRRQPSRGGTSRMTRESQVRFCERLGVKFPGPTRQNPNPPFGLLCLLPPAADIPLHWLWGATCRYCFWPGANFPAVKKSDRRPRIVVASITLPRSPASLSSGNEVPHIFTRKSRVQPKEILITSAKRLLQQNLPIG